MIPYWGGCPIGFIEPWLISISLIWVYLFRLSLPSSWGWSRPDQLRDSHHHKIVDKPSLTAGAAEEIIITPRGVGSPARLPTRMRMVGLAFRNASVGPDVGDEVMDDEEVCDMC